MSLTSRQILLGLALAFAGALAWWLEREPAHEMPNARGTERRPDYIIDDLSAVNMDSSGRPAHRMQTPQLRHYRDDGSSELERPVLDLYKDDGPPWRIRAETGWVSANGDEVLLQGQVVIDRAGFDEQPAIELRSSEMLVIPDKEYAETDRFVEIESAADWITAIDGMQAWFGEALRAKLFGRARGQFTGTRAASSGSDPGPGGVQDDTPPRDKDQGAIAPSPANGASPAPPPHAAKQSAATDNGRPLHHPRVAPDAPRGRTRPVSTIAPGLDGHRRQAPDRAPSTAGRCQPGRLLISAAAALSPPRRPLT